MPRVRLLSLVALQRSWSGHKIIETRKEISSALMMTEGVQHYDASCLHTISPQYHRQLHLMLVLKSLHEELKPAW